MKLIIDIDDDYYEIVKHDVEIYHNDFLPFTLIANGTPLPKGHGRIADIDKVLEEMRATRTYDIPFALERAKPIIEADKEANDG